MKTQSRISMVVAVGLMVTGVASAQSADKAKLPGGTWSAIAELPDFTGVWEVGRGGGRGGAGSQIQLTPAYAAKLAEYRAHPAEESSAANCVPPGMPAIMTQPYPIEVLFTPGKVTILIEAYEQIRHIYTDGRALPEDPDLTWNGTSIGHWEGDTLVVETVGFAPETRLGTGMQHSDKMKIVERMKLRDPENLEIETTVSDPEALTQPFTRTSVYARHRDWTMAEYICQQNNRNFATEDGKAGINLTFENR